MPSLLPNTFRVQTESNQENSLRNLNCQRTTISICANFIIYTYKPTQTQPFLHKKKSPLQRLFQILISFDKYLNKKLPNKSFQEQRAYRAAYQKLSNLVFIEISDQKLVVKKAPSIGWLEKFYSDNNNFLLTFPQVQGLNSAWQWYQNGISIPVLRNKIHPYYGMYFPTRFDHLEVFDKWLKRYKGPKKSAIDVGIGCGVLSFQMVKHGFQKVFGTDTNPNSIVGLSDFMGDTKLSRKIDLDFGHLFGKFEKPSELILQALGKTKPLGQ